MTVDWQSFFGTLPKGQEFFTTVTATGPGGVGPQHRLEQLHDAVSGGAHRGGAHAASGAPTHSKTCWTSAPGVRAHEPHVHGLPLAATLQKPI